MDFRKIFPIFLICISFYLTIAAAKKSDKNKSTTPISSEIQLKEETGDSVSSELQVLKEIGINGTVIATKKPKHRRKNKNHHQRTSHHRRTQVRSRLHKKKRTRPSDILTADDDEPITFKNGSKTELGKEGKVRPNSKSRGVRHLDTEREVTNGHSGHLRKDHFYRQHRRRRFHHKKHSKLIASTENPISESLNLQDINPNGVITL